MRNVFSLLIQPCDYLKNEDIIICIVMLYLFISGVYVIISLT